MVTWERIGPVPAAVVLSSFNIVILTLASELGVDGTESRDCQWTSRKLMMAHCRDGRGLFWEHRTRVVGPEKQLPLLPRQPNGLW